MVGREFELGLETESEGATVRPNIWLPFYLRMGAECLLNVDSIH